MMKKFRGQNTMEKKFFKLPEDQGYYTTRIRFLEEQSGNIFQIPKYVTNLPIHYKLTKLFLCRGTKCPYCEAGFPIKKIRGGR